MHGTVSNGNGVHRPQASPPLPTQGGEPANEHAHLLARAIEQMVRGRRTGGSIASRASNASDSQTTSGGSGFGAEAVNFEDMLETVTPNERDIGDRLRRHLQFFFMDPLEKWKVRRQFPFKLALQVLKILFVTVQLILFAELRISHVDFMEDTNTVMRHKFLKNWDDDRDAIEYPPSEGRYSVYDGKGIFEHLQFIIGSYYDIQTDSFATFSYDLQSVNLQHMLDNNASLNAGIQFENIPYLKVCVDRIANVTVNNNTYEFDINNVYDCFPLNLTKSEVDMIAADPSNVEKAFAARGMTFKPEDALLISKAIIKFKLRTIHFSPVTADSRPECYLLSISITFDNSRHTGQIHVNIMTEISYVNVCNGRVIKGNVFSYDTIVMGIIDVCVLFMCLASLILCIRALIKAHLLKNKTVDFFENIFKVPVNFSERLEFLNLWYVMILVNDICIIIGTVCKVSIEFRDFDNDLFTLTGILLGMGALLVYVGVLRYFKFFNKYNVLMLTLKKSLPNILRFLSCAVVLYCGFLIAGWVIIGPYSMKFRTLGSCSEALFSLINGDDMFATFYTINDSNTTIKIFGTIYIYVFVSLFIYVVLSTFIAIIMDAYEVVKDRYSDGVTVERSCLRDFMATQPPPSLSAPGAQAQYSPSNLLNLGAGNDSNSPSGRALHAIDRLRDMIRERLHGTRFQSFSNPLDDQTEFPVMNNGVTVDNVTFSNVTVGNTVTNNNGDQQPRHV